MRVRLRGADGRRLAHLPSTAVEVRAAADASELLSARLRTLAAVLGRLAVDQDRVGALGGGPGARSVLLTTAESAPASPTAAVTLVVAGVVVLDPAAPVDQEAAAAACRPPDAAGDAALRYSALSAPYHQAWYFSATGLEAARAALDGLREAARRLAEAGPAPTPLSPTGETLRAAFWQALTDDLDTPTALAVLWRIVRADLEPGERRALMLEVDAVLDLGLADASRPVEADLPPAAQVLIELRAVARRERDWARSDALRAELAALGVESRDGPDGSTYLRT